jgi:hypothetical protein
VRELRVRSGTLLGVAVIAAAVLAALVVVVVGWNRGQDDASSSPQTPTLPDITVLSAPDGQSSAPPGADGGPRPEVAGQVVVAPREVLFGDTVRARFEIVVDKEAVDPDSVRVAADFEPWDVVGRSALTREDDGDLSYLRTAFLLRCVSGTCVPSGQSARHEFRPARITYGAPSGEKVEESFVEVPLPPVRMYSRFAIANRDANPFESPWRADTLTLPAVTYGRSPGLLIVVLLGAAAFAVAAGVALAYVAWPRRAPAPPPEPAPPPPEPALSPLEQALVLLEHSIRVNGAAAQRRALEQVAEQLELSDWGDPKLAREARVLAWSEDVPPVEETTSLAARVRSALPVVEQAEQNGDGRVA